MFLVCIASTKYVLYTFSCSLVGGRWYVCQYCNIVLELNFYSPDQDIHWEQTSLLLTTVDVIEGNWHPRHWEATERFPEYNSRNKRTQLLGPVETYEYVVPSEEIGEVHNDLCLEYPRGLGSKLWNHLDLKRGQKRKKMWTPGPQLLYNH